MLASCQKLRGSVKLRHHLQGHVRVGIRFNGSCKAEVTNLKKAVAVDEQIARLQIPGVRRIRINIIYSMLFCIPSRRIHTGKNQTSCTKCSLSKLTGCKYNMESTDN